MESLVLKSSGQNVLTLQIIALSTENSNISKPDLIKLSPLLFPSLSACFSFSVVRMSRARNRTAARRPARCLSSAFAFAFFSLTSWKFKTTHIEGRMERGQKQGQEQTWDWQSGQRVAWSSQSYSGLAISVLKKNELTSWCFQLWEELHFISGHRRLFRSHALKR